MHKPSMSRLGVGLLVVGLAACTTVGVVGYPAEYIATKAPGHVWVTRAGSNEQLDLYNPQLHGDTLAAFDRTGGFLEMPVADVQLMRAPMASPGKTALLAATAAIGTALVISHIQGGTDNCVKFNPGAGNNGLPVPCGNYGAGGSGNVLGF